MAPAGGGFSFGQSFGAPATSGAGMFGSAAPAVAPSFGSAAPAVAPSFGSGGMLDLLLQLLLLLVVLGCLDPPLQLLLSSFGSALRLLLHPLDSGARFLGSTAAAASCSLTWCWRSLCAVAPSFGSAAPAVAPSFGSGGMSDSTTAAAPATSGAGSVWICRSGCCSILWIWWPCLDLPLQLLRHPGAPVWISILWDSLWVLQQPLQPLLSPPRFSFRCSKTRSNQLQHLDFGFNAVSAVSTAPPLRSGVPASPGFRYPVFTTAPAAAQASKAVTAALVLSDACMGGFGAAYSSCNLISALSFRNELEATLDSYQAQVLALSQSDAQATQFRSSPADNEREKAYTLAENLNKQLDDMSLQLTVIIDDMNASRNAASSGGTSGGGGAVGSKPVAPEDDNPISAIVHILNDHLASLEWIDKTSNDLASRVVELKRISGNVGEQAERVHHGGAGGVGYGASTPLKR
ncbi:hypothetical protein BASA62_005467 [Batrachochytrium salamandrivorans]|nr:hypothetical protein BASA62_005467 [Batrachochytrium salamandrivorans]